jgi:hypothetical protein
MRAPKGQPAHTWAFNPAYYRISVNGMCSADPERQDHMYWNAVDHTTTGNDLLEFFADAIVIVHAIYVVFHVLSNVLVQADQWLRDGDILVVDNAQTHHKIEDNLREMLADAGVTLLFLPKYCPEFNPIELVWSKVKYTIRRLGKRTLEDALVSLQVAMDDVSFSDVQKYFRHRSYAI